MDHLWAPWRLSYVAQTPKPKSEGPECFLCRATGETDDRANLVVARTPWNIAILNRYPYNSGHLLIAPKGHKADFRDLTDDEFLDGQKLIRKFMSIIEHSMKADGFNVGLNLGRVAGAGVPGHLHWHIVPRWNGDGNFMSVLSETRVISQALDALWVLLTTELSGGEIPV